MSYIRPQAISGFPEWLPEIRRVEQHWLDIIREVFESFGFCSIETPSVEALEVLAAKGDIDKEIYTLTRLQADKETGKDSRLALHYDLTVPLARYTAQHFNALDFPFKRYQIQRAWRGERPQDGRFREFYQCDIDVLNVESLPLSFDAELPEILYRVLERLGLAQSVRLHLSNRKILDGFLKGLAITDTVNAIRCLDKLDKIGPDKVMAQICTHGVQKEAAQQCLSLAAIKGKDFVAQVQALGVSNAILQEGLEELQFVTKQLAHLPENAVLVDLSIARGFDYYTGTVYEGRLIDYPDYGSVCAGGRYDDLAGSYISRKIPGVGLTLGLTRLFWKMLSTGDITPAAKCPTDILVVLPSAERRAEAKKTSETLRARGFKVELFHAPSKLKRQLSYAEKKGIPFVWFPPFEDGRPHEIKDMKTGEQKQADPKIWTDS